jgi:nitrogen fixation NifU-like protein
LPAATHSRGLRNPICGDQIVLDLRVEDGVVIQAHFDGRGCVLSRAAASALCEEIEGKSLDCVLAMTPRQMLDRLGIPLSPVRQQCALLAFRCLQLALANR